MAYIVHKAVDFDKLKVALKKHYGDVQGLVDSGHYQVEHKYDGCSAVRIPGKGFHSRDDKHYISLNRINDAMSGTTWDDYVVFGEAWKPETDFNLISGEFRRGEVSDSLMFIAFDVVTLSEFENGVSYAPYAVRREQLKHLMSFQPIPGMLLSSEVGTKVPNILEVVKKHGGRLGYDGFVAKHLNAGWTKGHSGNDGAVVKVKPLLSYDLRVSKVIKETGAKTGRDVYSVEVDFFGKTLGVGSGVPHNFDDVPKVGDIIEVEAMKLSSNGLLREPRFKGIRHDKENPDA